MTRPPGSDRRSLTLLHLSDPQFGRHHRETTGATAADREHDTLGARLLQDLTALAEDGAPVQPQLVVITGDLSEWARPSELAQFERFAARLLTGLGLPRERLVVVPGNHDVSWKACEAYFAQCEAEECEPTPPYWPKWRFFTALFGRLYGGPQAPFEFNETRPWSLFVYEPLRTVVAGLNSTMPETHREGEHYGELGEAQLRWFAEQLRPFRDRGWLRIAALHHNVQRKAVDDDENLRDATRLEQLLGDTINLVLHGHTHDGKLEWLRPQVPIVSTGSAAVKDQARPHGVPCQYQVLRIHPGGLRRWTRAYQPAQSRWVGDTAASVDGNEWRHEHAVVFDRVHGVFAPAPAPALASSSPSPPPNRSDEPDALAQPRAVGRRPVDRGDDFLTQLAEICRLRESTVQVVRRHKGPPLYEYLELRRQHGDQVELVPLAGHEHGVDEAQLDAFVQRVAEPYRQRDPGVRPVFVHGGPPAPPPLVARARAAGVWLRSYEQHCGLIDFRRYQEQLAQRLAGDRVYPPDKYVGQRMVEHLGRQHLRHDDALEAVRSWLSDEHGRFVLVLGSFGTGKTFLLRRLAQQLAAEHGATVPILVEMRNLEKGLRLEQLLAQHFALHEVEDYSPARFGRMLEDGRVVLLFDGFDELVVRSTYARAAEHFDTIVSAARGRAKVVVTSRRQHFLSDHQAKEAVRQVLMQQVEAVPGHRVVTLLPFENDQIERFLAGHLGDVAKARARMRLIEDVRDLCGLSANPRMLGFIAALTEDELRAARDQRGAVSAAGLYRSLLERWLAFEQDRRHPRGAAPGLPLPARWRAVTELAVRLWTHGEHQVGVDELEQIGAVLVELAKGSKEEAGFQIGSGTLLVRDPQGRFSFIHESVLEWLVARAAADALRAQSAPDLLGRGKMSPLLADFLIDLAGPSRCERWSSQALARNLGNATANNALLMRQRLVTAGLVHEDDEAAGVDLAGQDLRGRDLSGQRLSAARLTGADLTRANLRGAVLRRARLDRTTLQEADLSDADLRDADLRDADLEGGLLLRAQLSGARLDGASLVRAKLLRADLGDHALNEAQSFGAALPDARPEPRVAAPFAHVHALALSPDGGLLAIGDGHAVRLWDIGRDRELCSFVPEGAEITALTFVGAGMLVVGTREGFVSRWSVGEGTCAWTRPAHDGSVTALASDHAGRAWSVSEDGRLYEFALLDGYPQVLTRTKALYALAVSTTMGMLVLGDANGALHAARIWELPWEFGEIHQGAVQTLAWSPDGRHLVSGGVDGQLKLFAPSATPQIELREHAMIQLPKPVVAAAFIDDTTIVSASWDGQIRRWIVPDSAAADRLDLHPTDVTALAVDPHTRRLVSASRGGLVRALVVPAATQTISEHEPAPTAGSAPATEPEPTTSRQRPRATCLGPPPRDGIGALAPVIDGGLTVLVDGRIVCVTPTQRMTQSLLDVTGADHVALSREGLGVIAVAGPRLTVHRFFPFEGRDPVRIDHQLEAPPQMVGVVGRGSARVLLVTAGERHHIQTLRLLEGEQDALEHRGTMGPAPTALTSSPDGEWIAVAGSDHSIHVISPLSHQALAPPLVLEGHRHAIEALDLSNERLAVSGSIDGTVRVWDLLAGNARHDWSLRHGVSTVALGPDRLVVAGSVGGTLHLWDAVQGSSVASRVAHGAAITSLAFPAQTLLATGSRNGTIKLWRLPSLQLLATLAPLPEGWAAFAPDGRYKTGGRVVGQLWHTAALCRFEVGELDEVIEGLRVGPDDPLLRPDPR
ncbi:MAG: pentapeptide repeat-containing protein [Myxococcota bacterium]